MGFNRSSGTAFGQAAPPNFEYQRQKRILSFPFHFLNNNGAMNVRPKNYSWPDFYDHVLDVTKHAYSGSAIARRFRATRNVKARWLNVARAVSLEGPGRIKYYTEIRRKLDVDWQFRSYFEQQTSELPPFYEDRVRKDLGAFWKWLPEGALHHGPDAYIEPAAAEAENSVLSADAASSGE